MESVLEVIGELGLLELKISGVIEEEGLRAVMNRARETIAENPVLRLLINASLASGFDIPNGTCKEIAPEVFQFTGRCAFYASNPLVFGMARVMQSYSFNESFRVFENGSDAKAYVLSGGSGIDES